MAESKHEDEASSTASFEELDGADCTVVHDPAPATALTPVSTESDELADDETIPDVLYVVKYMNQDGTVAETRKSDKPIIVEKAGNNAEKKKPVIEILTRVKASPRRNTITQVRSGPGFVITRHDCSDSEDDAAELSNVAQTPEMIIHSEHLKNALRAVVGYYPGVDLIADDQVSIPAPYQVLVHHRDALAHYRSAQPACHGPDQAAEAARHIDVLLGFLDETYGARIREEEGRHRRNPPAATCEWLWMLFKPGEVLYHHNLIDNRWTPCVIASVGPRCLDPTNPRQLCFGVECWNLAYRNGRVRRVFKTVGVPFFTGEQAVRSLNIIPAAFMPAEYMGQAEDGSAGLRSVEAKQIELGRTYWELLQRQSYKEYEGMVVSRGVEDAWKPGRLSGRVIVDAEGYDRFHQRDPHGVGRPRRTIATPHMRPPPIMRPPELDMDHLPYFASRCPCDACVRQREGQGEGSREAEAGPFANFENLNPWKDSPPQNELYFLVMSKHIPAFILAERRWTHLAVEDLREVKPDREAFKHLVLEEEVKLTVKSLIGKFASEDGKVSPWPRDLIKNKGEGRIFLLHGSPGVGKTATCEAAAELGRRPLLSLTSGDISTSMDSSEVEENLNYYLQLCERFGALVLLDEADVYLERRRTKDLARNGLVSIFLRALEWFRGILFLTTNRVGAFDDAFTSRIHVALHYRRLTDQDRRRVWDNHLDRLERDTAGRIYVGTRTRDFIHASPDILSLRLNGRQIKNVLQVAVSLAEAEAAEDGVAEAEGGRVSVSDRHVRAVVKMNRSFQDFMRRRRGRSEDDDDDSENDADSEVEANDDEIIDDD